MNPYSYLTRTYKMYSNKNLGNFLWIIFFRLEFFLIVQRHQFREALGIDWRNLVGLFSEITRGHAMKAEHGKVFDGLPGRKMNGAEFSVRIFKETVDQILQKNLVLCRRKHIGKIFLEVEQKVVE